METNMIRDPLLLHLIYGVASAMCLVAIGVLVVLVLRVLR
jgi:hypothetical protein